jgi:hypothetical protein
MGAAALLLEVIADEASGDSNACAFACERDLGLAKPDCMLFSALIREALGLLERQALRRPAEAALIAAVGERRGHYLRKSALAVGCTDAGDFDRIVNPAAMVGTL